MRVFGSLGKPAAIGAVAFLLAGCGGGAAPASSAAAPASKPAAAPASSAAAAKPATSAAASAKPAGSGAASAKPAASGAASAKPAASGGSATLPALPKPEVTNLRLGNTAHEADSFSLQLALERGYYKDAGFTGEVTHTYFDGDAKGRQAILAGQIDVLSGSASSSIISQTTDTPMEVIGMMVDHPTDDLVSIGSVKNVGDLKGKKVAVSTFGGDSHASVLLSLKALGISDKDVTVVPIGGESARIAALKSGTVAAAPVDETLQAQMKQQGFNILVHLPDAPVTLARQSLQVRKDFAAKNPNATLDLLAATMRALQLEVNSKDDPNIAASYQKWIAAKDRNGPQQELDSYASVALRSMAWKPDGFENLKQVMVIADPKIANVDVSKAYDSQYLDKLKQLGWDKAIGVPAS